MSATVETGRRSTELPAEATLPRGPEAPIFALPEIAEPVTVAVPHHGVLQAFQSLVTIIVVALFIITFTVQPFRIPSRSMEPTLLVGDFLLVDKEISRDPFPSVLAPTSEIHRGDLIVFHYPVEPSLHLVKRVIGLPGDHIRLHEGHVLINDRPIAEPYAVFRAAVPDTYRDDFPRMSSAVPGIDSHWWIQMRSLVSDGELTVPPNNFFVLGDNRNDSEDSRYWGFVPRDAIVGKPFLIYFSLRALDQQSNEPALAPDQHRASIGWLIDIARWDRAMHVIH
jgi:signal peptidase I